MHFIYSYYITKRHFSHVVSVQFIFCSQSRFSYLKFQWFSMESLSITLPQTANVRFKLRVSQNNSSKRFWLMDKNLRETTNLCVEIMNSKRQVEGENLVTWYKFAFTSLDVDVMFNLSNIKSPEMNATSRLDYFWRHGKEMSLSRNVFMHRY